MNKRRIQTTYITHVCKSTRHLKVIVSNYKNEHFDKIENIQGKDPVYIKMYDGSVHKFCTEDQLGGDELFSNRKIRAMFR